MTDQPHDLELGRDEQRKRGWYLSWACQRSTCDSAGNCTTPSREVGITLFGIVADGHRKLTEELTQN